MPCEAVKKLGLNVVGCQKKEYAHYTVHTVFLKDETDDKEILRRVKAVGLTPRYDFLQHMQGLRHGANKILNISTDKPKPMGLEKLTRIQSNGKKIIKVGW